MLLNLILCRFAEAEFGVIGNVNEQLSVSNFTDSYLKPLDVAAV